MFPELFSVAGKTALIPGGYGEIGTAITGGTRGIGYMIAEGYLRAGVRVYISSRKPDACELAQQELSQFGEVHAIPADVSKEDECRALINQVAAQEDSLHILVNNAGATWGAAFDEFPGPRGTRYSPLTSRRRSC